MNCPECGGNIASKSKRFYTRTGEVEVRVEHKCEGCGTFW